MPHNRRDALWRKDLPVLFGGEKSRDECIYPHLLRRPFARQILGEIMDRGFGGGIGEHPGQRHDARHGAEVDNRTTFAPLHEIAAEYLAAEEYTLQVDFHDPVELVLGDIE